MTDYELSETLRTAARSVGDNVALEILLLIASERLEHISRLFSHQENIDVLD